MIYGQKSLTRIKNFASGGQNPFEKGFWTPKTFHERYDFLLLESPL